MAAKASKVKFLGLTITTIGLAWAVFVWFNPPQGKSPPRLRPVSVTHSDGQPGTDLLISTTEGQTYFPDQRGVFMLPEEAFGTTVIVQMKETWVEVWSQMLIARDGVPTKIVVPR
jgi:hypothetical protein